MEFKKCPHCDSDITKDSIVHIDGGFIGVYDGVVAIRCLSCNNYFPREDNDWAENLFERFMEKLSEE